MRSLTALTIGPATVIAITVTAFGIPAASANTGDPDLSHRTVISVSERDGEDRASVVPRGQLDRVDIVSAAATVATAVIAATVTTATTGSAALSAAPDAELAATGGHLSSGTVFGFASGLTALVLGTTGFLRPRRRGRP